MGCKKPRKPRTCGHYGDFSRPRKVHSGKEELRFAKRKLLERFAASFKAQNIKVELWISKNGRFSVQTVSARRE